MASKDLLPVETNHAFAGLGIAALAALVVGAAWAFELFGGFLPCQLCLEQREGYYVAMLSLPLAAVAIFLKAPACLPRGLMMVGGLALASSAVTGVYHAGAEWALWMGPADCGAGEIGVSTGSLLDALENEDVIFCDEAAGRFLGLSFAGWNVLAAGPLALLTLLVSIWPASPED